MRCLWSAGVIVRALLFCAVFTACTSSRPSALGPRPSGSEQLVVVVPGVTGSKLCGASGAVIWGNLRSLIVPWDGGRALARPLDGSDDGVRPCGPIRELRIGSYRKDIYGGLLDFLVSQGFATEFFDYDWRRDNVESARLLADELRGRGPVALICQSNGTYICRYLAKYGDTSGIEIEKIVMIGTANRGAVRILQELNRGRQYFRLIGRRMRPETLFSFESLFQDLPPDPMFDPENWERYRWSVFADGATGEERAHLGTAIASGRRLHVMLAADSGRALPRYYSIQSSDQPTPARVVIDADGRTRFETDAGDRHATVESQAAISNEEKRALGDRTVYVKGRHFEMITTGETRALLLRFLREITSSSGRVCPVPSLSRRQSRDRRNSSGN